MDMAKKKKGLVIIIMAGLIIFAGVFAVSNTGGTGQTSQQHDIMNLFLKAYYNVDDHESYDMVMENIENKNTSAFEYYEKMYNDILTEDAYVQLIASRAIVKPEQIVKDFDCKLELLNTKFERGGDTLEGYPTYSYKADVKITLSNQKSENFEATGYINFTQEGDKWKIDYLKFDYGALSRRANELFSGS